MNFLIHYDRTEGRLVSLTAYEDRKEASRNKLRIEIEMLSSGLNHEIVVLEATDEVSLRKTHKRYFTSLDDLRSTQTENFTEKTTTVRFWNISADKGGWKVKSDGMPESIYPTREQAVAAAALDAKQWLASTGRPAGYRTRVSDGSWKEEFVFNPD
jgi:hypothetical protein